MRFAADLRSLRVRAGSPTYRELARRAHYSSTTLADAAGGRNLPSLAVTSAYARACGGDVAEWEHRWRTTADELDSRSMTGDDDTTSDGHAPYVGFAAYRSQDAEWFRGRDRVVALAVDRLVRQRFVAVVGASGAGKSSVLRAGLLPAMTTERRRWVPLVITPGTWPLEECGVQIAARLGVPPRRLVADFREESRNLGLAIRQLLAGHQDDAEFLLVVDQFEEVFTLCRDAKERDRFIAALLDAAHGPDSRTRVVVGLRSDFHARCARHPQLAAALRDAEVLVGPMSTEELIEAITQPAGRAGLMVEKTLVTTLVHDAGERPGALPFVSQALLETWRRRHGNGLFLAGYRAAGGVDGAIAQTADSLYSDLDERRQRVARAIFLRLTSLGEGTEDTRRSVCRGELLDSPDRDAVADVLSMLITARLVTVDADTVVITHETLIRGWPVLHGWLTADRDALRAHRHLTESAAEWESQERDDSLLYRGPCLGAWQDRPFDGLNDVELAFLAASRRVTMRERDRRRRRVRLTMAGLVAATAVVGILAVIALGMAVRAENQQALAVGRQLVADARTQLELDPELALLLAREVYARTPNDDTEALLRQATAGSHVRATLRLPSGEDGMSNAVTGIAFSLDGEHLATTSVDGAARVWSWDGDRVAPTAPRVLGDQYSTGSPVFGPDGRIATVDRGGRAWVWNWTGQDAPVALGGTRRGNWAAAFSQDERQVAVSNVDGTIQIWRTAADELLNTLRGHTGRITGVAFSPDGRRLASSGVDGSVRVWDLVAGGEPVVLRTRSASVEAVTFSPDGRHVTTADADGAIQVWDATGVENPVVLGGHDSIAEGVAYNREGNLIASAGSDGTVRVWNADHPAAPTVLRGHHGAVHAVAFSPDGRTVVSGGADGTVKVWDIDEVENVAVFGGHRGSVMSAVSGVGGQWVAGVGADGGVRLWSVTTGRAIVLPGTGTSVTQLTFSPDGMRLAAVDGGGVRLWRTDRPTEYTRLSQPDGLVRRVTFSPDGRRLAVANSTGNLWIWNTPENGRPDRLPTDNLAGDGTALEDVAWSPDGGHVAAATSGGSVLLWNRGAQADPAVLPGRQSQIRTLTFSPDGTRLVTGGEDGQIRMWDIPSATKEAVLDGHHGAVRSVTFTPDGHHMVSTGTDATVRIWNTGSAGAQLVLDGFRASVPTVAALHGGLYVTAHDDGTIRVWRCPACGPVDEVLGHARQRTTRDLTPEERRRYLPAST